MDAAASRRGPAARAQPGSRGGATRPPRNRNCVRPGTAVDDDAVRCGPGWRCAPFVSPRAAAQVVWSRPQSGRPPASSNRTRPGATGDDGIHGDTSPPGRARSKPTAHRVRNAGRPGAFVVTRSCAFYILHTRLRTHRASGVPRALFRKGVQEIIIPRALRRREIAGGCAQYCRSGARAAPAECEPQPLQWEWRGTSRWLKR